MPKQTSSAVNDLLSWLAIGSGFLLPLFFLPITTEYFDFQKNSLLVLLTLLFLVLWLVRQFIEKQVKIVIPVLLAPLTLFSLSFFLSLFIVSPNKFDPLTLPGSAGTVVTLLLLFFTLVNIFHGSKRHLGMIYGLCASAAVLGIMSLMSFAGIFRLLPVPEYMKLPTFTPTGMLLPLASFLGIIFVWILSRLMHILGLDDDAPEDRDVFDQISTAWHQTITAGKESRKKADVFALMGLGTAAIFILGGLGASVYQLNTTSKQTILSPTIGWQVAVEGLKDWKTGLLGVGPTNFLSAYTRFRPLAINTTDQWQLRFINSSNVYFHYLSTLGILGLISFLFILYSLYQIGKKNSSEVQNDYLYALYAIFIVAVFIPPNFLWLTLLFLFAAFLSLERTPAFILEEKTVSTSAILVVLSLIFSGIVLYFGGRVYKADVVFRESLVALSQNRGLDVYNKQMEAINLYPFSDVYHTNYAQTNLALATSISRQAISTGSGQLSDNDRQAVTNLIQQAIREAKVAVALNPFLVTNWENLGQIYRSLINIAQGADVWSLQVYQQAINLDPTNPELRIILGSLFYSFGRLDDAIYHYQLATVAKQDYANSYYNLALAYREKKDFAKALDAMQKTLSLLPANTADRERVTKELEELRVKLPGEETGTTPSAESKLTAPSPAPTGLKQPITLPTEAGAPEITPEPTKRSTRIPTPTTIP